MVSDWEDDTREATKPPTLEMPVLPLAVEAELWRQAWQDADSGVIDPASDDGSLLSFPPL